MKTRNLLSGLAILILALSACREINVSTTVNNDGSFTRVITVSGDSAEAFSLDLPYPLDTSWAMTSKKDTTGKGKYIVVYTKHYRDCETLQTEIKNDTSWRKQQVRHIDIRKRSGFFFSYLSYSEVYAAANPFTIVPFKDFLTPEDILWVTHRHPILSPADSVRSKEAEDKAMDYLAKSATAEIEKILTAGILKLKDPRLDAKRVPEFRDSIMARLTKDKFCDGQQIIDTYRVWTGNAAVERLKTLQPPLFREFEQNMKFLENQLGMEKFHTEAVMPGLITATNSPELNGNRVSWDIFPMSFLFDDYAMTAESRVINVWAFVVSGLVLLALIGLLVIKALSK